MIRSKNLEGASGMLVWAGALLYSLLVLHSMYRAERFAFHDLALTNDYLANTVHQGRFFWAADYGVNHMGIHFTPTLILLTPLYAIVDSQFVLLVISTVALYVSLLFVHRMFTLLVPSVTTMGVAGRLLWSVSLVVLLTLNVYTPTVLVAAHYEPIYMLGAAATLHAILTNARLGRLFVLAVLTVGVREDAGVHLVFQMLAVLFVGAFAPAVRAEMRRKVAVLSLVATAYVAIVVLVVLPAFGPAHAAYIVKFWGNFGTSPAEIITTLVSAPGRVLGEVVDSGFARLNATFGYLSVLNPPVFLLTNLSGVLLYVSAEEAKKYLWYYNAAFLLPGAFLGLAAGLAQIERLAKALTRAPARMVTILRAAPVVVVIVLAGLSVTSFRDTIGGQLQFKMYPAADKTFLFEAIEQHLTSCSDVRSVASDFTNIVFFPNRYAKYMLVNFKEADVVFLVKHASMMLRWGMTDAALEEAIQRSGAFVLVHDDQRLAVYRKVAIDCGAS